MDVRTAQRSDLWCLCVRARKGRGWPTDVSYAQPSSPRTSEAHPASSRARSSMDRLACVDVPELALQLALRDHPSFRGAPVVVVDEDKPQGLVLSADRVARSRGV